MKCVDLFAGCGGLSLGFEQAGINVVAALDKWEKAVDVYNENFGHTCYLHDLRDEAGALNLLDKYKPALIAGGPPCQDFSSAGKRDESLGRADLTQHFANIVCSHRPEWFVMENVERVKKSSVLSQSIEQYQSAGYGLSAAILSAEFCGVPQARKRFFLIGHLGDLHNALLPTLKKNLNKSPMTIRDYLGDSLGVNHYYRHPRTYHRRGIFSVDEPSPTVRGVNRPLPSTYKKHAGDPEDADLSTTRPLTTVERSYIQTFPKSFSFKGTKTNLEQMIGNAVPVNLARFVAQAILEYRAEGPEDGATYQQQTLFDGAKFNGADDFLMPTRALQFDV